MTSSRAACGCRFRFGALGIFGPAINFFGVVFLGVVFFGVAGLRGFAAVFRFAGAMPWICWLVARTGGIVESALEEEQKKRE
jgi:hypothetical protein